MYVLCVGNFHVMYISSNKINNWFQFYGCSCPFEGTREELSGHEEMCEFSGLEVYLINVDVVYSSLNVYFHCFINLGGY